MFDGFETKRLSVNDTEVHLRTAGKGPPLLLVHGYPQTHIMWHKIAPQLAEEFTVVCPDLRGYGDSGKPATDERHFPYSKRAMAQDLVEVMAALGHSTFFLAGHDRGGRVSYRLTLDHPEKVAKLATLDIVPTVEQFERMGMSGSMGSFHWFFLAQPAPLPETMIGNDPDFFLRSMLSNWAGSDCAFTSEAMAEYSRCFSDPATIHSTCEDYRAGATVDCAFDAEDREAGHKITCPMLALWGDKGRPHKREAVLEVWQRWATNLKGRGIPCGHFLPEEAPNETLNALRKFFANES